MITPNPVNARVNFGAGTAAVSASISRISIGRTSPQQAVCFPQSGEQSRPDRHPHQGADSTEHDGGRTPMSRIDMDETRPRMRSGVES
jgi:hypothetical protein